MYYFYINNYKVFQIILIPIIFIIRIKCGNLADYLILNKNNPFNKQQLYEVIKQLIHGINVYI